MSTHDDHRSQKLKDRKAGRLFTGNRTKTKIAVETAIRSMAMTMRVLLRKQLGVETFTIWMVLWGFVWIRFCMSMNAAVPEEVKLFDNIINPYAFGNTGTSFLNIYSFCFLVAVIWYYYITELPQKNSPVVNVLGRGESVPLQPIIKDDKSFLQKEGFVQAVIAPSLGVILGSILLKFDQSFGLGVFFLGGSFALLVDEINYHRAAIRYDRILKSQEIVARKKQKKNQNNSSSVS